MKVEKIPFGNTGAQLISIVNDHNMRLEVTDFGARIVNLFVPRKDGEIKNVVLGFDTAEEYLDKDTYFGATIGRVAGRIAGGKFTLNGQNYQAVQNEGKNTLHGGPKSFEEKIWTTDIVESDDKVDIIFNYSSPDGENGFPGNLDATVVYTLTNDNEWTVTYKAESDKATLYNPTNHVYFNLSGNFTQDVSEHELWTTANKFAVIDDESLPTGELRDVKGTPFDFTSKGTLVGQGFTSDYQQNQLVSGYDHPFVFPKIETNKPQAVLTSPDKQLTLSILTDAPTVVIYTTNIGDKTVDLGDVTIGQHAGITMETQLLPDAIHHEGFGDIVLSDEGIFSSFTTFRFE